MLYICNPYFEWELKGQSAANIEEASLQHLIFAQLQFLPLLYAEPGSSLIVSAKPEGVFPHTFYFPGDHLPKEEKIVDWGASRLIEKFAKVNQLIYKIPNWEIVQRLNSKLFSFERFPMPGAARIHTIEELLAYIKKADGPVVLKDCLESSGRGHYFFFPDRPINEKALEAIFKRRHPLIAEPWVERIQDFSTQWEISASGGIRYLGLTICHNDALGKYRASEVGNPSFEVDLKIYEKLLEEIAAMGFFGNLGIDGMFYHGGVQPVVEINPRKTMGFVALEFQRLHFPNQHLTLNFDGNEAVAKLLCPEKSKILSHVASDSIAGTVHPTRSAPGGPAEKNGRNMAQKGDFNGQMSFATASKFKPNLLPDSAITKKGTRLKFRKTLSLELWKPKNSKSEVAFPSKAP